MATKSMVVGVYRDECRITLHYLVSGVVQGLGCEKVTFCENAVEKVGFSEWEELLGNFFWFDFSAFGKIFGVRCLNPDISRNCDAKFFFREALNLFLPED